MSRFLLAVLAAIVLCMSASAQDQRDWARTLSFSDSFEGGTTQFVVLPDTAANFNVSSYTMQANEPASSCASGAENRSVWFSVSHPGGSLRVDTTHNNSTTYDTVVAVFQHGFGPIGSLVEVACADNTVGSRAIVEAPLPSAGYLVRITCVGTCSSALLSVAVSYVTSKTAPNDTIANATPLTLNTVAKSKNVQFATGGDENANLGCPMEGSIWYQFAAPSTGTYSFSSAGSLLIYPTASSTDTVIAVYKSSTGLPNYASLTQLGCNDDNFGTLYGTLSMVSLAKGEVIFVRVGRLVPINALAGSTLQLKVTTHALFFMIENGSFETPLGPSGWVLKNATAGDGQSTEFKASGAQSFKFSGAPNKSTTLQQTYDVAARMMKLHSGGQLILTHVYSTKASTAPNVSAALIVSYTDGTPKTKVTRDLAAFTATGVNPNSDVVATVASPNVNSVKAQFKAKNATGAMYLDSVSMMYLGPATRDESGGVLPLPPAP